MPLVDAYSDYIPQDFLDKADALSNFPDDASLAALRRDGVRYAVVHVSDYKGEMGKVLETALARFAPDIRELYADENTRLYEINAAR
jgi:hypothetical protein